jgi:hypothetical protein
VAVSETLIVLLGNGNAVTQGRGMSCQTAGCAPPPWSYSSKQMICAVRLAPEAAAACKGGAEGCEWADWRGGLIDCKPLATNKTCADLAYVDKEE